MKQRWLIEPRPTGSSPVPVQFDPETREAVVALMAMIIESAHSSPVYPNKQRKEASDHD